MHVHVCVGLRRLSVSNHRPHHQVAKGCDRHFHFNQLSLALDGFYLFSAVFTVSVTSRCTRNLYDLVTAFVGDFKW